MAEIDCASAFEGSGAWRVNARLMMSKEMGTLFFVLRNLRGTRRAEQTKKMSHTEELLCAQRLPPAGGHQEYAGC